MKAKEMNAGRAVEYVDNKMFSIPKLLIALVIPLGTGLLSAVLTSDAMQIYGDFNKPALAPPAWLFPVAWTVLYILMGTASYLVFTKKADDQIKRTGLFLYGAQLVLNFGWSIIFFAGQLFLLAFLELMMMWVLIILCAWFFFRVSKTAGLLMVPTILWTTFAAYLNFSVYIMSVTPTPVMMTV